MASTVADILGVKLEKNHEEHFVVYPLNTKDSGKYMYLPL
jgi:hypothetical protein